MEGEVKGKTFKMKGHTLPGINQRSEGNTDLPDGRSKSSTFQQDMTGMMDTASVKFDRAAQTMQQRVQAPNIPGGGVMGGVGVGADPSLTPPIVSKPSVAKIYDKPKGKRTEY